MQDIDEDEDEKESELSEEDQAALEAKFKKAYDKAVAKIEEQIEIASEAISKAEEISEKYGIPFHSSITPLSQSYRPASFSEKWAGLEDSLDDLTDGELYGVPDYEGWEHSAVC
ncbi:MAG TPA: hypothetical protein VM577_18745 [Anaerovoracaceae bacterium]|nr:hypothetical protein [Anaerovoracaceae bacterium]